MTTPTDNRESVKMPTEIGMVDLDPDYNPIPVLKAEIATLRTQRDELQLAALEYGYKCCEKGMNIQAAILAFSRAVEDK